jgi:hypothetical protein
MRTLIRTLKIALVNSLVNFTCKIDKVLVNYLYILIVHFWELFVNCFVKPAQGLATSFVDATAD